MGVDDLSRRAVFLDRDGVVNRARVGTDGVSRPPSRLADVELLPGASAACRRLRAAGLLLIVVTNQPDVARGTQSREGVEEINAWVRAHASVDDVRVCYHDDADMCGCRKPAPGLLLDAARDWEIDLAASYLVGDRLSDIRAGERAGCMTIFVGENEGHRSVASHEARSLARAADWILDEDWRRLERSRRRI